jgi:hypothetical protein
MANSHGATIAEQKAEIERIFRPFKNAFIFNNVLRLVDNNDNDYFRCSHETHK